MQRECSASADAVGAENKILLGSQCMSKRQPHRMLCGPCEAQCRSTGVDLLRQAAGAYGMNTLYGVAPPLMAWTLRKRASGGGGGGGSSQAVAHPASTTASPGAGADNGGGGGKTAAESAGSSAGGRYRAEVPGGGAVLAALCASAVAVEAGRAAMDLGWLRIG